MSASVQQQVEETHNVKKQSTKTEFTAQKLALSLHDKQGTIIDSWNKHVFNNFFCDA